MSRTKVRDRKSKVKGWDLLMTTEQTYSGDGVLRAQAEGPEGSKDERTKALRTFRRRHLLAAV